MAGKKKKKKDKKDKPAPEKKPSKEDGIIFEAVVTDTLKGAFRVQLVDDGEDIDEDNPKPTILAHIAGRLRRNYIRIVKGDRVRVEMSPYDLTKGRIIYRLK